MRAEVLQVVVHPQQMRVVGRGDDPDEVATLDPLAAQVTGTRY